MYKTPVGKTGQSRLEFTESFPDTEKAFSLIESLLDSGMDVQVRVTGRSMRPFIKSGDVVVLRKVRIRTAKLGDIVYFRDEHGKCILHRLMEVSRIDGRTIFQTKADALRRFDSPVESGRGRLLARVWCVYKIDQDGELSLKIDLDGFFGYFCNRLLFVFHLLIGTLHDWAGKRRYRTDRAGGTKISDLR